VRESYIEGKVKRWARAKGVLPLKMNPASTAGYPDDLFVFRGRVAFIEFKAPGRKPRPLQHARIAELREQGCPVGVIDNVDDGIAFLEAALLSRASGALRSLAGVRWVSFTTRHGQDYYQLCDNQDTEEQELDQAHVGDSPSASGVQRLAQAEE
jgi:hypothetical protein